MRKNTLRQTANQYLQLNHFGSFRERKQRTYVIKKLIDDLYLAGDVPPSWQTLTSSHMQRLINHWRKNKLRDATIMRHMTIIRHYLKNMGCDITHFDNKSLQLKLTTKQMPIPDVNSTIWKQINEPTSHFIMALQAEFGLTFAEAIELNPTIHIKPQQLWLTREVTFNSTDRTIPIRHEHQKQILTDLTQLAHGKSLIQQYGYQRLRINWHTSLQQLELPKKKSWRYLYARQMFTQLEPILGHYQARIIISDEMGIKSRNSL